MPDAQSQLDPVSTADIEHLLADPTVPDDVILAALLRVTVESTETDNADRAAQLDALGQRLTDRLGSVELSMHVRGGAALQEAAARPKLDVTTVVRGDHVRLGMLFVDKVGVRHQLKGILIEPAPVGVTIVGTDGCMLGALHDESGFTKRELVAEVPKAALKALRKQAAAGRFTWFVLLDAQSGYHAMGAVLASMDRDASISSMLGRELLGPSVRWCGRVELQEPSGLNYRDLLSKDFVPTGNCFLQPELLRPFFTVAETGERRAPAISIAGVARHRTASEGAADYALLDCGRADFTGVIACLSPVASASVDRTDGVIRAPAWARHPNPAATTQSEAAE